MLSSLCPSERQTENWPAEGKKEHLGNWTERELSISNLLLILEIGFGSGQLDHFYYYVLLLKITREAARPLLVLGMTC